MGALSELIRPLAQWDEAALELSHGALAAGHRDVRGRIRVVDEVAALRGRGRARRCRGRRGRPTAALSAVLAAAFAEAAAVVLKQATDRARPPLADPAIQALVALPGV